MTINSDIIFRIGSKPIGGFTELKSAIDLLKNLHGFVKQNVGELDKFSQAWQRTNQQAVMAADKAAKGLVDTGTIVNQYNKMMTAGVKMTDQQFQTMTVRAVQLAKATGTDATEAFKKLTDGVSNATSEALKPFGVKLKEGADMSQTQQKAIEALTKGYEGLSVEVETTSERLYVLENNLGTFKGLLWDATSNSEAFAEIIDGLNSSFSDLNEWLAESPKTMGDFVYSMENARNIALELGRSLINLVAGPFVEIERAINSLMGISGPGTLEQAVAGVMSSTEAETKSLENLYKKRQVEKEQRKKTGAGSGAGLAAPGMGKRRGGGGGGGGGGPKFEMHETTESELAWAETTGSLEGYEEMGEGIERLDAATYSAEQAEKRQALQETVDAELEGLAQLGEARGGQLDQMGAYVDTKVLIDQLEHDSSVAREEYDATRLYNLEQSQDFARNWSDTWMYSFDRVSAGAIAAKGAMDLLHAGVAASVKAAIYGQKSFKEAMRSAVEEVALNVAIEAGFMALMELAKGIAATASYNIPAAALHFAAMAKFLAVAAVAGAIAGAAHSAAPDSSGGAGGVATGAGPGSGYTGGGPSDYGSAPGYKEQQEVTINIQLKDGSDGFFNAIVEENDKASMDGRRSLAER